jgi:NET1-associated nuclear protein 1 (U3 small nucleolar RNA-associated protein 17)
MVWCSDSLFFVQAKGGALSFIQGNQLSIDENELDGKPPQSLLAYINGDREYLLFDAEGKETNEFSAIRREGLSDLEESGGFP